MPLMTTSAMEATTLPLASTSGTTTPMNTPTTAAAAVAENISRAPPTNMIHGASSVAASGVHGMRPRFSSEQPGRTQESEAVRWWRSYSGRNWMETAENTTLLRRWQLHDASC
jgi:hypothetical protein